MTLNWKYIHDSVYDKYIHWASKLVTYEMGHVAAKV